MQLRDQPAQPTLARQLGDIAHMSGLAIRLARQSGAGERLAEWLMKVAVERGAHHYQREFDPKLPADVPDVPDEEIAVALCLNEQLYNLDALRAAAQLLTSPRIDRERLAWLALQERCEPVLLHIAAAASACDPALEPWAWLRTHLPPRRIHRCDALPHWSRLVSHSGLTAGGGPARTDWLRRHE